MGKLKIIVDSACDVTLEEAEKDNITVVPFSVSFDDKLYQKEHYEISVEEFYKKLLNKDVYPKTSLPSIAQYAEAFEKELKEGNEILCICLSSKLSGSYQSAVNAKNIVLEEYKDGKICVIDSLMATYSYYLLAKKGQELYNLGKSLDEIEKNLLSQREQTKIYFVIGKMDFLEKGGRLGKGAALAGNILNIKPVLEFSDGEIKPVKKARGLKNAYSAAIELIERDIEELTKNMKNFEIIILNAGNEEYIEDFNAMMREKLDMDKYKYHRVLLGTTIATHTGPDVVGIGVTVLN